MPVVSVSLNDELLKQMEEMETELGFSGRSELVRAGVRHLLADQRQMEKLTGEVDCVLLLTHHEDEEEDVTRIKHDFNDVVKTHVHNKLGGAQCLEVFVLKGEAETLRGLVNSFRTIERMHNVQLISA